MRTTHMHMHRHILHTCATKSFVTALCSIVKQYYSKVISLHKRLTSFGGHGQQQRFYVSHLQHKDPQCLSFLARSSILPLWLGSKYF